MPEMKLTEHSLLTYEKKVMTKKDIFFFLLKDFLPFCKQSFSISFPLTLLQPIATFQRGEFF